MFRIKATSKLFMPILKLLILANYSLRYRENYLLCIFEAINDSFAKFFHFLLPLSRCIPRSNAQFLFLKECINNALKLRIFSWLPNPLRIKLQTSFSLHGPIHGLPSADQLLSFLTVFALLHSWATVTLSCL